jgi:Na+/proline symporter
MMSQDEILSPAWRQGAARSHSLVFIIMVATALVTCWVQWVDFAALRAVRRGAYGQLLQSDHPSWAAWTTQWIASAAVLLALARVMHMLRHMAKGDPFARTVTADLRAFAFWVLMATLASIFLPLALAPILGWWLQGNIEGPGEINGSDLLLLLMTAILYHVSRLLDAARAMADDYRQIV